MDDKEQFNAFDNQKDEVKAKAAVEKLRSSPFGMHVIAAQICKDLRRRCDAKEEDVISVHTVPPNPGDPIIFFAWMDVQRSKVDKDLFVDKSKEIVDEVKKYMPDVHFVIKLVEDPA